MREYDCDDVPEIVVDFWAALLEEGLCPDCLCPVKNEFWCTSCNRDAMEIFE